MAFADTVITEDQQATSAWRITKATTSADGSMAWQATTTKFSRDQQKDMVTRAFYEEAIKRFKSKTAPPPFFSVAHYPVQRTCFACQAEYKSMTDFVCSSCGQERLIAGVTTEIYIDGDQPKAKGIFFPNALGKSVFEACREDIKNNIPVDERIRISMGFYPDPDGVIFKSEGRDFTKGWIEHFAATRVPVVPETDLEVKSLNIKTKYDDAAAIVPKALADKLVEVERLRRVGKSGHVDELVIKSEDSNNVVKELTFEDVTSGAAEAAIKSIAGVDAELIADAVETLDIVKKAIQAPGGKKNELLARASNLIKAISDYSQTITGMPDDGSQAENAKPVAEQSDASAKPADKPVEQPAEQSTSDEQPVDDVSAEEPPQQPEEVDMGADQPAQDDEATENVPAPTPEPNTNNAQSALKDDNGANQTMMTDVNTAPEPTPTPDQKDRQAAEAVVSDEEALKEAQQEEMPNDDSLQGAEEGAGPAAEAVDEEDNIEEPAEEVETEDEEEDRPGKIRFVPAAQTKSIAVHKSIVFLTELAETLVSKSSVQKADTDDAEIDAILEEMRQDMLKGKPIFEKADYDPEIDLVLEEMRQDMIAGRPMVPETDEFGLDSAINDLNLEIIENKSSVYNDVVVETTEQLMHQGETTPAPSPEFVPLTTKDLGPELPAGWTAYGYSYVKGSGYMGRAVEIANHDRDGFFRVIRHPGVSDVRQMSPMVVPDFLQAITYANEWLQGPTTQEAPRLEDSVNPADVLAHAEVAYRVKARTEPAPAVKSAAKHPAEAYMERWGEVVSEVIKSSATRLEKREHVQKALDQFGEEVVKLIDYTTPTSPEDVNVVVQKAVQEAIAEVEAKKSRQIEELQAQIKSLMGSAVQKEVNSAVMARAQQRPVRRSLGVLRPQEGVTQAANVEKSALAAPVLAGDTTPEKKFSASEVAQQTVAAMLPTFRY